jgi:zinc protease
VTRRTLFALAAVGTLAAQRRNRAPVSKQNLVVKIPQAIPVKLSNGVTVLAVEDNRVPLAYVRFQVEGAGSLYEPRPGGAEFTAAMLPEGTATRSGKQIVEEAARLGASLASSSSAEVPTAEGSGLSGGVNGWFDLLADLFLHPAFPADDFSSLRQRRMLAIRRNLAQAGYLVQSALLRLVYSMHPAARINPPLEALAALTPEMLAAWHRERYAPANTVVSCIGRLRPSSFVARAEQLLGGWKTPEPKIELPPAPLPASSRRVVLIDRPGSAQTELAIGGLLFDRRDPDFFAMSVLNSLLGGGPSSRLFQILRSEKGYAYNVGSNFNSLRYPGAWSVSAAVRTDSTADSLAIILAQLRRFCDEPVSAEEIDEARRSVVGRFALTLEQPLQVINLSYLRYRYGFSADYAERYPAKVTSVTAAEVQGVAQKYLNPDRAHIAAAGDAAKIRGALAKLGRVEA